MIPGLASLPPSPANAALTQLRTSSTTAILKELALVDDAHNLLVLDVLHFTRLDRGCHVGGGGLGRELDGIGLFLLRLRVRRSLSHVLCRGLSHRRRHGWHRRNWSRSHRREDRRRRN